MMIGWGAEQGRLCLESDDSFGTSDDYRMISAVGVPSFKT